MTVFTRWRRTRQTEAEPSTPSFDEIDPATRDVVDAMLGIVEHLAQGLPESVEGPSDPDRIRSREELRQHWEAREVWQDHAFRQHLMATLDLW